jgi:hypothetical protein
MLGILGKEGRGQRSQWLAEIACRTAAGQALEESAGQAGLFRLFLKRLRFAWAEK